MTDASHSTITLEYLKIILGWPVVVGLILVTQRKAIAGLIERLTKLKAPGVEFEAPTYPKTNTDTIEEDVLKALNSSTDTTKRLEALDKDFSILLYRNFLSNLMMIDHLSELLWKRSFWERLKSQNTPPEQIDKPKAVILSEEAKQDLDFVRKTFKAIPDTGSFDRQEMIRAYLKSETLVEYLRELSAKVSAYHV